MNSASSLDQGFPRNNRWISIVYNPLDMDGLLEIPIRLGTLFSQKYANRLSANDFF